MNNEATPLLRSPALNAALFATALTSISSYFLFGLIYKFTHHRPLGAATLAVMVVGAFFAWFALSARLRVGPTLARAAFGVAFLVAVTLTFVD